MGLDVYAPFQTWLTEEPDFNRSDELAALAQLAERERLIEALLSGAGDIEETLETLHDQGIDPDVWVDACCENIQTVIDNGITFISNDKGLFLPSRFYGE